MQLLSHLQFSGQCEEAFKFYEKCLGGKIQGIFRFNAAPPDESRKLPAAWENKVMHVSMKVGDRTLMGTDAPPDHFSKPQGFQVCISLDDIAEGQKIFNALSEKGTVAMPFGKTFWSPGFAMFEDRYGIPWMINCKQPI